MMTEEQKQAIRNKVEVDNERMQDALASHYLGRLCPIDKQECSGMKCFAFLLQQNAQGKIAGGACSLPLIASQVGPIADALLEYAAKNATNAPRVIGGI